MILVFEIGFENIFERVILRFEFLGRYKPTPLKRNLILEIRLPPKQVGKLFLQGIFSFPGSICFGMSAPLNTTNSECFHRGLLGDCVQDFDWNFLISKIIL